MLFSAAAKIRLTSWGCAMFCCDWTIHMIIASCGPMKGRVTQIVHFLHHLKTSYTRKKVIYLFLA